MTPIIFFVCVFDYSHTHTHQLPTGRIRASAMFVHGVAFYVCVHTRVCLCVDGAGNAVPSGGVSVCPPPGQYESECRPMLVCVGREREQKAPLPHTQVQ